MSAWLTGNKSHKIITIGYPKKKGCGWGHGISMGIEGKACRKG